MNYSEWFEQQDESFKNEINPHKVSNDSFIDHRLHAIDLDQLIEYDNQYCCYKSEDD